MTGILHEVLNNYVVVMHVFQLIFRLLEQRAHTFSHKIYVKKQLKNVNMVWDLKEKQNKK